MSPLASVPILGVPIHHVTFDEALDRITELVERGRAEGESHQIVTVNTDFLVSAERNPDIHRVLREADLAVADGMPVVWASKVLGAELPERVAGADLVPGLVARAAATGHRVMFFGGAGDSAAEAAEVLRAEHPGVDLHTATGMVGADGSAEDALLDQLRSVSPDVLCVGLGHPKQEHFIQRQAFALGVPVSMGTGATFEFICGSQARAPEWMQRTGLEWLHRMVRNPGRLVRRYATDARVFGPAVRRQRRIAPRGQSEARVELRSAAESNAGRPTLDMSSIDQLDAASVVALSSRVTEARARGASVELLHTAPSVRDQLDRLAMSELFTFSDASPEDSP